MAHRLWLRKRSGSPSPGAIGVAQGRPGRAPQPPPPALPRGISLDQALDAHRPGPRAHSAVGKRAEARGTESKPAPAGKCPGQEAGPEGKVAMIAKIAAAIRLMLSQLLILPVRFYQIVL